MSWQCLPVALAGVPSSAGTAPGPSRLPPAAPLLSVPLGTRSRGRVTQEATSSQILLWQQQVSPCLCEAFGTSHAHSRFSYPVPDLPVVADVVRAEPEKRNWNQLGEAALLVVNWSADTQQAKPWQFYALRKLAYSKLSVQLSSWLLLNQRSLSCDSPRVSWLSRHPLSAWAAVLVGLHLVLHAPCGTEAPTLMWPQPNLCCHAH